VRVPDFEMTLSAGCSGGYIPRRDHHGTRSRCARDGRARATKRVRLVVVDVHGIQAIQAVEIASPSFSSVAARAASSSSAARRQPRARDDRAARGAIVRARPGDQERHGAQRPYTSQQRDGTRRRRPAHVRPLHLPGRDRFVPGGGLVKVPGPRGSPRG
jgi:hypothetical protein